MTYELLPEFVQDSPEWHEARTHSLGASEVAAVLGLSPWQTRLSVYRVKMGVPNEINPDAAYWGHAHEPTIAQWMRDKHPEVGKITNGFSARSLEHPWLTATPDRVADDAGLLIPIELKTDDGFVHESWIDNVPDYYRVQSIVQQGVIGAPYGWLAVLHGTKTAELMRIPFDETVWEQIVRITGEFWRGNVEAQIPPEPVTSAEAIQLWPGDPDLSIEGGQDLYEVWGAYGLLQAEQVEIGKQLDGMKLELQKAMTDATTLTYQGRELFTWRPRAGARRFDTAAFKKDHPDMSAEYTRQGAPTRTFLRKTVREVEE